MSLPSSLWPPRGLGRRCERACALSPASQDKIREGRHVEA